MKKSTLILLLLCVNNVFAQLQQQLNLPLLKENHQIDSLFDTIIQQTKSDKTSFSFVINKATTSIFYSIQQIQQKGPTICLRLPFKQYLKDAGYFMYKGYTIIVCGDRDEYNFFERTNTDRLFNFIWYGKRHDIDDFSDDFEYGKGQFFKMKYDYIDR